MKKYTSKRNGRKGGRPKGDIDDILHLPDLTLVLITEHQYNALLSKYEYNVVEKALHILDRWLKNSPEGQKYAGKNNYGHFRSDGWLINLAKDSIV